MSKVRESTLYGMVNQLTYKRRSGNTTRLIDNAIQILFKGKVCIVEDHHEYGKNKKANKYLFERILERLSSEHPMLFVNKNIKIDYQKLELELVPSMIERIDIKKGGVDLSGIDKH